MSNKCICKLAGRPIKDAQARSTLTKLEEIVTKYGLGAKAYNVKSLEELPTNAPNGSLAIVSITTPIAQFFQFNSEITIPQEFTDTSFYFSFLAHAGDGSLLELNEIYFWSDGEGLSYYGENSGVEEAYIVGDGWYDNLDIIEPQETPTDINFNSWLNESGSYKDGGNITTQKLYTRENGEWLPYEEVSSREVYYLASYDELPEVAPESSVAVLVSDNLTTLYKMVEGSWELVGYVTNDNTCIAYNVDSPEQLPPDAPIGSLGLISGDDETYKKYETGWALVQNKVYHLIEGEPLPSENVEPNSYAIVVSLDGDKLYWTMLGTAEGNAPSWELLADGSGARAYIEDSIDNLPSNAPLNSLALVDGGIYQKYDTGWALALNKVYHLIEGEPLPLENVPPNSYAIVVSLDGDKLYWTMLGTTEGNAPSWELLAEKPDNSPKAYYVDTYEELPANAPVGSLASIDGTHFKKFEEGWGMDGYRVYEVSSEAELPTENVFPMSYGVVVSLDYTRVYQYMNGWQLIAQGN